MHACGTMPCMRGRGCMLPCRISEAVFFLPQTLIRTVTFGVDTIHTLPTLPKVCIFAWRLGHDYLPIGSQVLVVGLGSGVCPFCSLEVETSLHAFRGCSDAIEALRLGGFPNSVSTSNTTSIFDWLFETAGSLSREAFSKFLLILWNRRNLWVHDSRLQPVWDTITTTTLLHEDFIAANDGLKKSRSKPILSFPTWSPSTRDGGHICGWSFYLGPRRWCRCGGSGFAC
ncbi:hypothetical protein V6N12_042317 [Hibiscus sabdariffa]|uniref:Reverse transcriptase zinc-binding domain-containing protein n=1 Tax=Hibiscus sabdariffa TaxID=183260 RepID=A0ABR2EEE9_9ROSI